MDMKNMWNERYDQDQYVYGTSPNKFFQQFIAGQNPGKLLLPAEGEGRNAVYAAVNNWQVHAFDYSETAKEKALRLARQQRVHIDYDVAHAEEFNCSGKFDLIAWIFTHFHHSICTELFQKFIDCLKPGGYWLMEVFSKKQLDNTSGGPKNPDLLYSSDTMATLLPGLDIMLNEETSILLNEGALHQGRAEVLQIIAQKAG
jgi:SAM-dependent methyltransferase